MSNALAVDRKKLEGAATDRAYLEVLLEKYNEVWSEDPDGLLENFTEEQLSFLVYGMLYDQVYNGGFLQLVFNGYANMVFRSPLAQSLREWGAAAVAELLESIETPCLQAADRFGGAERSLELLSASYSEYPEFEAYDRRFYDCDGTAEIKAYIAAHLTDFVQV